MNEVAMCKVALKFVDETIEYDEFEYDADFVNSHLQEFFGACTEGLSANEFECWCDVSDFFEETILYPAYCRFVEMVEEALGEETTTEIRNEGFCNTQFTEMCKAFMQYLMKLAKAETGADINDV